MSYESKNIFIFSLFYDPFYCNMICFTALLKIITVVATCSYWLPILVYAFVLSSGKESMFQWGQIQPPPPLQIQIAFSWFVYFVLFKYNCKKQKQSAQQYKILFQYTHQLSIFFYRK